MVIVDYGDRLEVTAGATDVAIFGRRKQAGRALDALRRRDNRGATSRATLAAAAARRALGIDQQPVDHAGHVLLPAGTRDELLAA
jgi:hypothetical protein